MLSEHPLENRVDFETWMDSFEAVYLHPELVTPCPNCSQEALRLIFLVDEPDDETATAAFWCDSCLWGLIPNRAVVAPAGVRVKRGTEEIPNYRIVPPS